MCRTKSLNVYTFMKHVIECIYFHAQIHIAKTQENWLIRTSFYSLLWLRPDWLPRAGEISLSCLVGISCFVLKVPNSFSGSLISLIWRPGFGILKQNGGEIRDWKWARCGMPKITLGITGLSKNLGQAGWRNWRTLLGLSLLFWPWNISLMTKNVRG